MAYTIVLFYGKQEGKCGYCKGTTCSISHGMHAYKMKPEDYQYLIDRGWRRSGMYCYKPSNNQTCCPSYTIKCDAKEFKLSKSHKRVLKRMNRFLRSGKKEQTIEQNATAEDLTETTANEDVSESTNGVGINDEPKAPDVPIPELNISEINAVNLEMLAENDKQQEAVESSAMNSEAAIAQKALANSNESIKPPCKKAKQMRLERREAKLAAKGIDAAQTVKSKSQLQEKTLRDYLSDTSPDNKHKLKIVLVKSKDRKSTDEAFNIYKKYQLLVHKDNPSRLTPTSLERFLYNSPLQYDEKNGPGMAYGSYHQQYWLDDKLIAVAVIDILPFCVSSVYFFYDPDYSFLSLGTYASLREIDLVQQLHAKNPELKYYYMGFYIHSCRKMRYKGRLAHSYLLCPEVYTWHPLTDDIRMKLEMCKYQRFNPDAKAVDPNKFTESDMKMVLMYFNKKLIRFGEIALRSRNTDPYRTAFHNAIGRLLEFMDEESINDVRTYGSLVGKEGSQRMVYAYSK